jgi:ABC-type glycerol-3-phosphate transport system substrate-binding protein
VLLVITAGLGVVSCNTPEPLQPVTASVLDWASDAPWHEPGQQAVGEAAKLTTGLDIHSVIFSTTGEYQAAVMSTLSTDKAYPIFDWWFAYRMKDIVDSGQAADVTGIWEKHIAAGEYPRDLMNSFGFNGRAYAVPKGLNYWVVFYNKRIFDKYDLLPPVSWDGFLSTAETLKEKGVTPIGLDVTTCGWCSFIWFEELLVRTDPRLYVQVTDGRLPYNAPDVLRVMKTWKDLIDKGYFTKPGVVDDDTSAESLARGEFAMYLIGDWWTANIEKAGFKANKDYGIFVMPGITPNGSKALIIEGRPVVVAEKSANKEAALKMADYFMSTEGQTVWATTSKANSPNLKVADETRPEHLRTLAADVAAGKYRLFARYWEATPPQIVEQVVGLLSKFLIDPESYQEVMTQAQWEAENYWVGRK